MDARIIRTTACVGLVPPYYPSTSVPYLGLAGEEVVEDEVAQLQEAQRPPRHLSVWCRGGKKS